jgi:hypothetical protein
MPAYSEVSKFWRRHETRRNAPKCRNEASPARRPRPPRRGRARAGRSRGADEVREPLQSERGRHLLVRRGRPPRFDLRLRGRDQGQWDDAISLRPPGKIELAFPAAPGKAADNFKGGWMSYSGGGGAYIRFSNGPFEYTAFSATGKWGANGGSLDVAGVAIRKDGKDFSNFVCRGLADDLGELGPDFLQKMGMSGADPDPDFAPPDAFLKK